MTPKRRRRRRAPVARLPAGDCRHGHTGCPSWVTRSVWCEQCQVWHCEMKPDTQVVDPLDDPPPF